MGDPRDVTPPRDVENLRHLQPSGGDLAGEPAAVGDPAVARRAAVDPAASGDPVSAADRAADHAVGHTAAATGPADMAGATAPSRLDAELVRRGLARSRAQARDLVRAHAVLVNGRVATKSSRPVGPRDEVALATEPDPWVSRAAYKLLKALEVFGPRGLTAEGKRCIDVGASTGGFTQVLLAGGAGHVEAVDVGHGQLVPELAGDPRVTEWSGTNVRDLDPATIGGPAPLVVADLSFISLRTVMPALAALTAPEGDLVVLVKPQFEVGRERLGKGGLVRRAADRARAVTDAADAALAAGLRPLALHHSPIQGSSGNQEYLLWCTSRDVPAMSPHEVAEAADRLSTEGPT